jgi:hypothetical protein
MVVSSGCRTQMYTLEGRLVRSRVYLHVVAKRHIPWKQGVQPAGSHYMDWDVLAPARSTTNMFSGCFWQVGPSKYQIGSSKSTFYRVITYNILYSFENSSRGKIKYKFILRICLLFPGSIKHGIGTAINIFICRQQMYCYNKYNSWKGYKFLYCPCFSEPLSTFSLWSSLGVWTIWLACEEFCIEC